MNQQVNIHRTPEFFSKFYLLLFPSFRLIIDDYRFFSFILFYKVLGLTYALMFSISLIAGLAAYPPVSLYRAVLLFIYFLFFLSLFCYSACIIYANSNHPLFLGKKRHIKSSLGSK
ncbi:hypothetical protein NEIRO03_1831 [Nematocida sp. AWRm78]|nr:hypothetical protein NEIRO02_1868 [Nematocida sp. AWRm79]KAI5184708.1 hypothetical protein NEIRO03_1831 [Nematocida sp. AWRm78]